MVDFFKFLIEILGTKITFEGEGDAADRLTIPGDIVFIIRDKPHPIFERSNSDLIYRVKLTLKQALVGTIVVIPFLDSNKAPYQLRTYRDILSPQTEKRFPNEGLPYPKDSKRHGDLIVKFEILFPKILTEEQRSMIDRCFSSSFDFYQPPHSALHTSIIDCNSDGKLNNGNGKDEKLSRSSPVSVTSSTSTTDVQGTFL